MQGVHLKELAVSAIGAIGIPIASHSCCLIKMNDWFRLFVANAVEQNIVPYFPQIVNVLKVS